MVPSRDAADAPDATARRTRIMADSANLAVHAYEAIKKRILEFHYRPGERLSEARLANDLGLGRSPIRTALAQLRNDGWISVSPCFHDDG